PRGAPGGGVRSVPRPVNRGVDTRQDRHQHAAEGQHAQRKHEGDAVADAGQHEPEQGPQHPALHQLAQAGDDQAADGGDDVAGRTRTLAHVGAPLFSRSTGQRGGWPGEGARAVSPPGARPPPLCRPPRPQRWASATMPPAGAPCYAFAMAHEYERYAKPEPPPPPPPAIWRKRLDAYWRLLRGDRPVGTLLLLWPTWWALWLAAEGLPSW